MPRAALAEPACSEISSGAGWTHTPYARSFVSPFSALLCLPFPARAFRHALQIAVGSLPRALENVALGADGRGSRMKDRGTPGTAGRGSMLINPRYKYL